MIARGDVLLLADHETGASQKPGVVRPCLVIAVSSARVVVAPRSVSVDGKVRTPAEASEGFTKDGSFSRWQKSVDRRVADAAPNYGQMAEPYLSQVLSLFARRAR